MSRIVNALLAASIMVCVAMTGCVKDPNGNIDEPDISNFAIESVSAWRAGLSAMVTVSSSSLASGDYTVLFDLTGANVRTAATSLMTMTGGRGTFSLPVMNNDNGVTHVVIRSIRGTGGNSATLATGNTYTFSDSTGLMTGVMAGSAYRATHVAATQVSAGNILTIQAIKWTPLSPVTLYVDNWNGMPGSISFNANDATAFLGSASYSTEGGAHLSEHGIITISTVSPLLTGTFSFTSEDSSVVSGSFSCLKP